MPAKKRPKPLYQRGPYSLYPRDGRNLEIIWYDAAGKRERSQSAGTADVRQGRIALDRLYLQNDGAKFCPTCRRPWDAEHSPLLYTAIADYLIRSEGKAGYGSAKNRLGHVTDYLDAKQPEAVCAQIDERWIASFRKWLLAKPVISPKGKTLRPRSLSHVEGCVMQLAAAINDTPGQSANFKALQATTVANSPTFRADIETLAAMFNFCLRPEAKKTRPAELLVEDRATLLAFLRAAVATWARPDAIYDISDKQWTSPAGVLDLNPPGRRQTKKHRPQVPIARQMRPWFDAMEGQWITVSSIRGPWDKMCAFLSLPRDGQAGQKLIRRTMATLARKIIGEANWRQGEMMLGHVKASISDIYAIPDPANLGLALAATESIIDDIEKLAPGAFYRDFTAQAGKLTAVDGGKIG